MEIKNGVTLVIIGKSGTGKSVLLKLIVGLLEPDEGRAMIDGKQINLLSETELYEERRKIGYVFQGAALFDSMTVAENLVLVRCDHVHQHNLLAGQAARTRYGRFDPLTGLHSGR